MNALVIVVFAASSLLIYALLAMVFSEDRAVARRLDTLTSYEAGEARRAQPLLAPLSERLVKPLFAASGRMLRSGGFKRRYNKMNASLVLAGRPAGLSVEAFWALRWTPAVMTAGLFVLAALVGTVSRGRAFVIGAVACVLVYAIPGLWLRTRIEHRQARARKELPDMLDMLTISVEAGLGFDGALAKYVKNSRGVLAQEFGRMLQEVQAGAIRRDAMRRLDDRVGLQELSAFVASMVQAEVLGTSVSQVLRTQASEMRLRRRQYAEEQAQKLPVKMVFPLVLCILPATMLMILGPAILRLMEILTAI